MKLSIFIPWFSPAYKAGGPILSIANMVEQFSTNISYKIFCSNLDLDGTVLNVPVNRWVKYNTTTEVWYTSSNKKIKEQIKDAAADILFINGIYSWHFNLIPLLFFDAPKKIVSARGMLHPGALSQKKLKKRIYLYLWKALYLHKKCDFHASNEEEKQHIQNVFGGKVTIHVAQNFPRVFTNNSFPEKKSGSLELLSIALISPMKNHLLVLKALHFCDGNITYNIYGPIKDEMYWNLCVEQIKKLPKNIVVKYHGEIEPHEVEKTLAGSHVFILPSKSENFGHAIFEAFTTGRPVITSNNTPWINLKESNAGLNVSTNHSEELTEAINFFALMGQNEFQKWSKCAAKYAAQSINLEDIKQQYRKMFFSLEN